MKNYVLLLSVLILSSCCNIKMFKDQSTNGRSKAKNEEYIALKNYKGDTITYVKENFIQHKEKYIGKEIDSLISKMELPIVKYYLGIHPTVERYYYLTLQFYSDIEEAEKIESKVNPITLNIEIDSLVETSYPVSIYRRDKQQWTQDAVKFWGKMIIKDIGLVNYGF